MKSKPIDLSTVTAKQRAAFWAKIDRGGKGCWLWTGMTNGTYGHFWIGSTKGAGGFRVVKAHRMAWMLAYPFRALGQHDCVCHHCDTPLCCRVEHMFVGSYADNNRDKEEKGRAAHPRGEANGRATITESDVRAILRSKDLLQTIGNRYNLPKQTIWKIKHRIIWKHVK